jgi:Flp pilus assembly protein TadG
MPAQSSFGRSPCRLRRALRRNSDGVTAVEFALVLPVLLAILFACIEFGMMGYTYTATTSAMNNVARQLATNQISAEHAQDMIRSGLPTWVRNAAQTTVQQSAPGDASINTYTIRVQYSAMAATPSHFLAFSYRNQMFNQVLTLRQEPVI